MASCSLRKVAKRARIEAIIGMCAPWLPNGADTVQDDGSVRWGEVSAAVGNRSSTQPNRRLPVVIFLVGP